MATDAARYVDRDSFEKYQDNDGQEIVVSRLVNLPADQAFDTWLLHVWEAPGTQLNPGKGRGMVGHVRGMPGGLREEIVAAGEPQTKGDAIASISYKVKGFGALPLQDHIAFVQFVPDTTTGASNRTLVVWSVKITPTTIGNVFCCGGSMMRLVLRTVLSYFMDGFVAVFK